jgi:hypothetical protein
LGALVIAALLAACREVLPVGPSEVTAEASNETFRMLVVGSGSRFAPGQPIDVFAEVHYVGPKAEETVYNTGTWVLWTIRQLDGEASMDGGMNLPCLQTPIRPGQPHREDFVKSGQVMDAGPFDRAWFEEPMLTLPIGRWRVSAALYVSTGDCGGESHDLAASIDLTVGG